MRALILVGGKATRLRPLTFATPKALTPVLGRPFLEYVLTWLRGHGVTEVTLLLGHLADPIRARFADGAAFGVSLSYVAEREPLGSGGAIRQLADELAAPFFAINGDIYTDLDLRAMRAAHMAFGAEVTIALAPVDDPSQYGVVALDGTGAIRRFVEKPSPGEAPSNLVNAGVWLFEPAAVRRIPAGRYTMVEQELFPYLARAGRLYGYPACTYWMDVGTPERYLQLHRELLTGRAPAPFALVQRPGWPGLVPACAADADRSESEPRPEIDPLGIVDGPCVIGPGTRVGERAAVAGPACLGRDVTIQAGAWVADSVLWDGCFVGQHAHVVSSVLAAGCIVEPGARIEGCVLGDRVRVRAGVTLRGASVNPGQIAA